MIAKGEPPPQTHDLTILSGLLSSLDPGWHWSAEELRWLSRAAVIFRYPGESAGPEEAEAVRAVAQALRERLLSLLAASS